MTKRQLAALEKIFAAEIEGRLPYQSKAKIYRELEAEQYVEQSMLRLPSSLGVIVVQGWQLTHRGRIAYCESCKEPADGDWS